MRKSIVLVVIFLTLVAATAAQASTNAWVWADSPSVASYTPNGSYAYNPTGGATSITRSSIGVYSVRFSNLVSIAGTGGNVQVTPYGVGTSNCRVLSWNTSASDLIINVGCYTTAGAPVDSMYTVLYTFN